MAISLDSLNSGSALVPPRLLIYGPHGIGKTSIAAGAPTPVFLKTEDGLGVLDVPNWDIDSFADAEQAIGVLATEDHPFKTVVLDTLDHFEPQVWQQVCDENGWQTIETPDYGKGYVPVLDKWRYIFSGFAALRARGIGVIFLAHATVKKFNSPETEPYDRYRIKLHESAAGIGANPLVQELVDCVFFNNYLVSVVKDQGKGDKKGEGHARGTGGGQRVVYTAERPAFLAKNRYRMPSMIMLPDDPAKSWDAVAAHIPYYSNQSTNAAAAA